jgi:hypothetical protein
MYSLASGDVTPRISLDEKIAGSQLIHITLPASSINTIRLTGE